MPRYEFIFRHPESNRTPYVKEFIDFQNDGIEGTFTFNGYWYIDDNAFPQRLIMEMYTYADEPVEKIDLDGTVHHYYSEIDYKKLDLEFYRREIIQNTDVISTMDDSDGEEMNICFFPTDMQKLFFRVVKSISHVNTPTES